MWAYLCGEYGVLAYPFAFGIGFAGSAAAEDSGSNACDAGTIVWVGMNENRPNNTSGNISFKTNH